MSSRLILACLGNPGADYVWTPHNAGFHVAEALVDRRRGRWRSTSRAYERADLELADTELVVVKPLTWMNRSGGALLALGREDPFEPHELLVVVDDFALEWGRLRLRRQGTDGGHNGLKSIIDCLHTTGFPRLRIGVGPVPSGEDPADYVLEAVSEAGRAVMQEAVDRAVDCVLAVVTGSFDDAMGHYNGSPSIESD